LPSVARENAELLYDGIITIFGPKRDEVIGGWRKQHNEELYNLYSSPNIVRTIK
jgi:hypothetical protein